MWCNQIFSLIKKEVVIGITEEEFNTQVQAYMETNSVTIEEASEAVLATIEQVEQQVVANICVCDNYEVANQIARMTYGDDAIAVDTTLYPLTIGDLYRDGGFYRGDILIPPNPTEEQRVSALEFQTAASEEQRAEAELDIDYRLSMMELGLA